MIDNSFTESYFRIENNLLTNLERAYIDREGKLILTTSIIETETFQIEETINAANMGQPENVNLIVDQITLFSTNPDVSNYLPLKISIADKQLEFDQPDVTPQPEYKIIRKRSINNPFIKSRRYDKQFSSNFLSENVDVDQLIPIASGFCDDVLYNVFNSKNALNVLNDFFTVQSINIKTKVSNSTEVDGTVIKFLSNEFNAFVIYDDSNLGVISFRSLLDGVNVETEIEVIDYLGAFLFRDLLYILYLETSLVLVIDIYTRVTSPPRYLKYYSTAIAYEPSAVNSIIGNHHANLILTHYIVAGDPYIVTYNIRSDIETEKEFAFAAIFDQVQGLNPDLIQGGGDDLDQPIINLFRYTETTPEIEKTVYWHRFNPSDRALTGVQKWDSVVSFKSSMSQPSIYRNFAVYSLNLSLESGFILCNLDNGEIVNWNLHSISPDAPIIYNVQYTVSTLSDKYAAFTFISELEDDKNRSFSYIYENAREPKQVYRLNQNYDERPFSYQLSNKLINVSFSLPNFNPVIDLELFKVAIDLRVRFTKERSKPNAMTQIEAAKGKKTKAPRAIKKGTTEEQVKDVLGLVDENFSVTDFLGIYLPDDIKTDFFT